MTTNNIVLTIAAVTFAMNGGAFWVASGNERGRLRAGLRAGALLCWLLVPVCLVVMRLPE
ncbi:MAG: hypothetical protein KBF28_05360 [Gemmatimonadales bacterium]|nr:hypothetical protein [Gemmatimonadales bacterium]